MTTIIRLFSRLRAIARGQRGAALALGAAVVLTACTSTFSVYQPGDAPDNPTGQINPLSDYLKPGVTDVKLVFIHGVGDHCPGYALSGTDEDKDKEGWLSVKRAAAIGLTPIDPEPIALPRIYSSEFLPGVNGEKHAWDDKSYVAVRTQHFRYGSTGATVEAIEITWSPLTQWIKNNQLANDFTTTNIVSCGPDVDTSHVVEAHTERPASAAQVPRRLLANRMLKETVLDRDLADAGIYMGQYRSAMQLGLADALCHTLTGQAIDSDPKNAMGKPCSWPEVSNAATKTRYLFVTHSLGSRMLYDTFFGLMGYTTFGVDSSLFGTWSPGARDPAADGSPGKSRAFVTNMLINTPVVYMMANQLAFLGLGNVPVYALSFKPEVQNGQGVAKQLNLGEPYEFKPTLPNISSIGLSKNSITQPEVDTCGTDPWCHLAELKNVVSISVKKNGGVTASSQSALSPTLDMIAFSDTNDLLSWSVSPWYQRSVMGPDGVRTTPINFVNVYVNNATHWLWLAEWPTYAHDKYFTNRHVRQAIICGASSSKDSSQNSSQITQPCSVE